MRTLSGNHKGWLNAVAREIREAGKPVSLDFLYRVVPGQFATATNDGHVTAAENGLSRDDYKAGWRIWIEETVAALIKAKLIETVADGYAWVAEQDGTWRVKFGRSTYTLYGQAESASARDRHMLGEEGSPGYLLKGWSEVEVEVAVGIRNKIDKGKHTLQVHPLAFAIPPMTPAEQELVRGDIAEHGVRMPLILYPDPADLSVKGKPKLKVLDGRHRLQFASALGKSVRVEVFEGTEQEAREYVWSVNAARRHLTAAQRALAIERLYGAQARAEAKQALSTGEKRRKDARVSLPDHNGNQSDGERWEDRAVKKAGGAAAGVSPRSVRAMHDDVVEAPKTVALIDAGEITSVTGARKNAAAELGKPEPARLWDKTARTEIGMALGHLRNAAATLDGQADVSSSDDWRGLVDEVDALNGRIRAGLRKRDVL